MATLEGISDDIWIKLDTAGTDTNDKVIVDLAGQAVDQVFVELGNGDNEFELRGGTVHGVLRYLGGSGDDGLTIDADVIIEGPVVAQLRSGNDRLDMAGQLQRDVVGLCRFRRRCRAAHGRLSRGWQRVSRVG